MCVRERERERDIERETDGERTIERERESLCRIGMSHVRGAV